MFNTIYIDNGATTQIDPRVVEAMKPFFGKDYGNASSAHTKGFKAKEALDEARELIADSINAKPEEIIFTSGGTESNNTAIKGMAFANKEKGNHIITTQVEHKCILNACKWLETQGFEVTYLGVNEEGFINIQELEKAITEKTILVSILHANNEIGTIQDMQAIGDVCKQHNIPLHTDACQSYTKVPIDVHKQHISLMSLNAHKIHGPKGVGALYCKQGTAISPLLHGGEQEHGLRAGTENIPGIVGFAKAVRIAKPKYVKYMRKLSSKFIEELVQLPDVKLNGPIGERRLCNNINIMFSKVSAAALGGYLDRKGICSSTGSACSEVNDEPSYVLQAIGLDEQSASSSIRLTLSRHTTEEEVEKTIKTIKKLVEKLRKKSVVDKVLDKL